MDRRTFLKTVSAGSAVAVAAILLPIETAATASRADILAKIKSEIELVLRMHLFVPNNETMRANVTVMVNGVLREYVDHFVDGEYHTECSELNNPPSVVDMNQLVVDASMKFKGDDEFTIISANTRQFPEAYGQV